MLQKFEKLESQLVHNAAASQYSPKHQRSANRTGPETRKCYWCGEVGHIKRQCPLNFHEPAQMVTGSWREDWTITKPSPCLNSILCIKGHTLTKFLDFLLDSGAAVSLIHRDKWPTTPGGRSDWAANNAWQFQNRTWLCCSENPECGLCLEPISSSNMRQWLTVTKKPYNLAQPEC